MVLELLLLFFDRLDRLKRSEVGRNFVLGDASMWRKPRSPANLCQYFNRTTPRNKRLDGKVVFG